MDWRVREEDEAVAEQDDAVIVNECADAGGHPAGGFDVSPGQSLGAGVGDRPVSGQHGRAQRHRRATRTAPDEPQYIVRLVGRVVTVSVETVGLVNALAAEVALPAAVAVAAE